MSADITPFIKDAQRLQDETGIPASITLGQLLLESSGKYAGGLSGLAVQAKNLFGVKGKGNAGSVSMLTSEYVNGKYVKVYADFRKYTSYYDSMVDHGKVLSQSNYTKHLKSGTNSVNDWINAIVSGGYATSPTYKKQLTNIISANNLHQYDTGNFTFTGTTGSTSTGGSSTSDTAAPGGMINNFYFYTIRAVIILMMFILMIVFFLKAFPAVEDVAGTVATGPAGVAKKAALKAIAKGGQ